MKVRVATSADAASIAEIYAPFVRETAVTFELAPPGAAEIARRIESTLQTYPYLVAVDDGAVVGFAYAGPHRSRPAYRWSVEISVYISSGARRRGAARSLYEHLFELLRRQNYVRLYAGVALPNDASSRLHESFGFEPIGTYRNVGYKLGRWHDTAWFSLDLLTPKNPPHEPIPFATLQKD